MKGSFRSFQPPSSFCKSLKNESILTSVAVAPVCFRHRNLQCQDWQCDNFAKAFKKTMSSDAYKGHFAGAYWSRMENCRNQLKVIGRDEK
jgi:hypothetical protein